MEKQTAVEWLEEELADNLKVIILNNDYTLMEKLFAKAKAMEKEQLIEAYNHNMTGFDKLEQEEIGLNWAEEYYNETFSK